MKGDVKGLVLFSENVCNKLACLQSTVSALPYTNYKTDWSIHPTGWYVVITNLCNNEPMACNCTLLKSQPLVFKCCHQIFSFVRVVPMARRKISGSNRRRHCQEGPPRLRRARISTLLFVLHRWVAQNIDHGGHFVHVLTQAKSTIVIKRTIIPVFS